MIGKQYSSWRGEPLFDIKQWCKIHNTQLVIVHWVEKEFNILTAKWDRQEKDVEIPAIFWDNMCLDERTNESKELSRYTIE